MSYEQRGTCISLVALEDYTDKRYCAMKKTAGVDEVFELAAAGEKPIGFLQDGVGENQAGALMVNGTTFAIASEAIPAGSYVKVTTDGQIGVGADTDGVGQALNAATAVGDIISVLLKLGS
jgi:hypothetical protein